MLFWLVRISAATLVVLLVAVFSLFTPIGRDFVATQFDAMASQAGYEVSFSFFALGWPAGVVVEDVVVAPTGEAAFLEIAQARVGLAHPIGSRFGVRLELIKPRLTPALVPTGGSKSDSDRSLEDLNAWLERLQVSVVEGTVIFADVAADEADLTTVGPIDALFEPELSSGGLRFHGRLSALGANADWAIEVDDHFDHVQARARVQGLEIPESTRGVLQALAATADAPRTADVTIEASGQLSEQLQGKVAVALVGADGANAGSTLRGTIEVNPRHAVLNGTVVFADRDLELASVDFDVSRLFDGENAILSAGVNGKAVSLTRLWPTLAPGTLSLPEQGWTLQLGPGAVSGPIDAAIALPPLVVASDDFKVSFKPDLAISQLDIRNGGGRATLAVDDLEFEAGAGTAKADHVVLQFGSLGGSLFEKGFAGELSATPGMHAQGDGWSVALGPNPIQLEVDSTFSNFVASLSGTTGLVSDIEWSAESVVVRTSRDRGKRTQLDATGVAFQDEAFERVAEKLAISLTVSLAMPLTMPLKMPLKMPAVEDDPLGVRVAAEATSGGLLYRRLFLDVAEHPLAIALTLNSQTARFDVRDGAATLGDLVAAKFSGHGVDPSSAFAGTVEVDVLDAGQAFQLLVAEPLGESFPVAAVTVLDGALSATATFERKADFWVRLGARLKSERLTVRIGEGFELDGMSMDLPLPIVGDVAFAKGEGRLAVQTVQLLGEQSDAVALTVTSDGTHLRTNNALVLKLFGGRTTLFPIDLDLAPNAEVRAQLSAVIENVSTASIADAAGLPAIDGSMAGHLNEVVLRKDSLRTVGELVADVFGGQARITNAGGDSLYGRVPEFRLAKLELVDIDLGKVTEALPVGHVSGVLRGQVENLAVAAGQPVAFEAFLESVSRSRQAQRISVTAINQISILGGSGGDPVSRGVLALFDEYRYAKLGLRCSLHNDVFVLRGIEQHDNRDYLVVGSWVPPSVNVISHNQVISFSEMVSRLSRAASDQPQTPSQTEENPS
ncbi:MAG: hypothetical protein ACI91F_003042 [Candidatus Binatia bacterium]